MLNVRVRLGHRLGLTVVALPKPHPFRSACRGRSVVPLAHFIYFQENSSGKSNYNSLQASLRVNSWHGINSVANYVWSRSLDNSSDGEDFVVNAAQPQDSNNPNAEYGRSNFDIPQRFTWIFSYELPTIGGGLQKLKNGWGLDSTVSVQSGQPFTLNYNFEDDYSGGGDGFDRPDVVGPVVYDYHNPANFLQLSSFAMPCNIPPGISIGGFTNDCVPGTQHYGNLGRNALQGPPFKQWDLAIYKNTKIAERVTLQLRVEIFNLLNHPNFSNPLLPAFIADPASNVNQQTTCGCGFKSSGNVKLAMAPTRLSRRATLESATRSLEAGAHAASSLRLNFCSSWRTQQVGRQGENGRSAHP